MLRIGYVTQEVTVKNQSDVRIVLKEDLLALDEVVVVGYGTMRKKDLTGSIMQIRPDKALPMKHPRRYRIY